jgi:hypothetical protein
MEDGKILDTREWPEDGEYGDIIKLLHKTGDIICTAAEVTNEEAKKQLFASAKILIEDCGRAIDERVGTKPVLVEEDD